MKIPLYFYAENCIFMQFKYNKNVIFWRYQNLKVMSKYGIIGIAKMWKNCRYMSMAGFPKNVNQKSKKFF